MSITPLAVPESTDISINDPRLTELIPNYDVFIEDSDGVRITERYSSLSGATRNYILALYGRGMQPEATRVANCMRSGSLDKQCRCGQWAHGAKHRCGDHLCVNCSRADVRFHKWASTRDHELFRREHTAIEIRTPYLCRCEHCRAKPYAVWVDEMRDGLRMIAKRFLTALGRDGVIADAFGEQPTDTRVRILVPAGEMTAKRIQSVFRDTINRWFSELGCRTDPKAIRPVCDVHSTGVDTEKKFLWLFGGLASCAAMDADKKARLREVLSGKRLVETIGDTYSPLSKEELAERSAAEKSEPCQCPVCRNYDVEEIPREHRVSESVDDIESRIPNVDWTSERTLGVSRKRVPTNNSEPTYSETTTSFVVDAAPPPW